jgi:threonine dehydratase
VSKQPTFEDVVAAAQRIEAHIRHTPVTASKSIDDAVDARVFLKCENLQRTGAFKFRGASNAIWQLSEEECARGVATHSSGNHGAALALAAKTRNTQATIVMPEVSVRSKIEAVEAYGGNIRFCGPTMADREAMLEEVLAETGAVPVHPYDDARIIAGQGTAALELTEEIRDLDALVVPVGGGGLLAGTALVGEQLGIPVFGAEPAGADDAKRSLDAGRRIKTVPDTIADGLRATVGVLNFEMIRDRVEDILTVSEGEIITAMRFVWQRAKIVIEASAAVPVAALLRYPERFNERRVGVVLTGGNLDLDSLPWARGQD